MERTCKGGETGRRDGEKDIPRTCSGGREGRGQIFRSGGDRLQPFRDQMKSIARCSAIADTQRKLLNLLAADRKDEEQNRILRGAVVVKRF